MYSIEDNIFSDIDIACTDTSLIQCVSDGNSKIYYTKIDETRLYVFDFATGASKVICDNLYEEKSDAMTVF